MRTFASLQFLVSKDIDQLQKLVGPLALTFDDNDAATAAKLSSGVVTLASGASNVVFPFGDVVTASQVLIVAYQEVTVKLDGIGSPAIPVRPVPAKVDGSIISAFQRLDQPGWVAWRGKVSSIHLGNPGADAAEVFVAVVGNAT